jgi:hypothetical protein
MCRVCKMEREHTVIVTDGQGLPLRTACGYCRSEHNYRGARPTPTSGLSPRRLDLPRPTLPAPSTSTLPRPTLPRPTLPRAVVDVAPPFLAERSSPAPPGDDAAPVAPALAKSSLVSDRERTAPLVTSDAVDLELLLRRIIREESGLTAVAPAAKWRGGQLVLRPAKADLQDKTWPIETFFHKIVMLRNRLRTLEQQINAADMPEDAKVKLQAYITGCYGSLTSFNMLFADEEDQFKGSGGAE